MSLKYFALVIAFFMALMTWRLSSLLFTLNKRKSIRNALEVYTQAQPSSEKSSQPSNNGESFRSRVLTPLVATPYFTWFSRLATKAGMWDESKVREQIWRKIELCVAALCLGALITRNPEPSRVLYLIVLPMLTFFVPDLLLASRAKKRVAAIEEALPETIDLLSMCVQSGLGFQAGMQRVAQTRANPLSEEFNRVLSEMRLGEGRSQAFQRMSERLEIEPLRQFVNSILQVDRLGIPIAKVLDDQSDQMRALRRESAREQAQKVPVKILAPIMLFLMPSVFIIVLGPAAVTVIRAFSR